MSMARYTHQQAEERDHSPVDSPRLTRVELPHDRVLVLALAGVCHRSGRVRPALVLRVVHAGRRRDFIRVIFNFCCERFCGFAGVRTARRRRKVRVSRGRGDSAFGSPSRAAAFHRAGDFLGEQKIITHCRRWRPWRGTGLREIAL